MSILNHKEVIKAWLDGATMEYKSRNNPGTWVQCKPASECYTVCIPEEYEIRIKPKTETTWVWVAEWPNGKISAVRSQDNPWPSNLYFQYTKLYKIEESKQETLIE